MKKSWYQKKWITVLIHCLAWILLFSLPYLLKPPNNPDQPKHPEQVNTTVSFLIARVTDLLLISFFYFNAIVLLPCFFYKRKFIFYLVALMFCFAVFAGITWILTRNFTYTDIYFTFQRHLFFCTFVFLFILACSIAYKTIRDKIISDNLAKDRENENLKTELSLLRMQVSPHFMFNVLNNMVALARKQSELLEPSLIKLSSLMRYMLYETGEEKVSLEKETDYLQSYIDLQQQRFGKKVIVHVTAPVSDRQYDIEPMLLIPFVENAFKHGTGIVKDAQINISLKAENNILRFNVSNKYDPTSEEIKDKASGIGLTNVQRRLELLYKDKHSLLISKNADTFTISLQIHLN